MNELSGVRKEITNADILQLGFCPHCHCSESSVENVRKISSSTLKKIHGQQTRVKVLKIVRYRRCDHCGQRFRTTETASE